MIGILSIGLVLLGSVSVVRADDMNAPVIQITANNGNHLAFGSNAISDVRLGENAEFNQISFRVDGPTSTALTKLTSENVGGQVVISVCGEVVSRPRILSPITSGLALAGFEWDRAREIADIIAGSRSCH